MHKITCKIKKFKKRTNQHKNNDQKSFLWWYVRHVNPVNIHPERITQEDKKLVNNLNYDGIEFPVQEKDFSKTETKNNSCINVFCYENKLTYPSQVSDQEFEKSMDLFLVSNKNKSHYVYIKDFKQICVSKNKK